MNNNKSVHDLIEDTDYRISLKQEIESLKGAKNYIFIFITLLFKDDKQSFDNFEENNISLGFGEIIKFILNNYSLLIDKRNNNLYIDYFLDLLTYFNAKQEIGSLYYFNYRKLERLDTYSEEEKEFYFFIKTETFYNKLILEVNNVIDNIIEDLDEELFNNEEGVLEGEVIEIENLVAETLLLENKIDIYISDFNKIFDVLFIGKVENISVILNDYNYLEKQENLYNFVTNNSDFIKKQEGGKLIHDFIIGISENSIDKAFVEHIIDFKLGNIKLHGLPIRFGEICKSL